MGSYNYYYGRYYNQLNKGNSSIPINYTYNKNSVGVNQKKRCYYNSKRGYNASSDSICNKIINKLLKQIVIVACFLGILVFLRSSHFWWAKKSCIDIDYLIRRDNSITYIKKRVKNLSGEQIKNEIIKNGRELITDVKDGTFEERVTDEIDKIFNGIRQQV